METGSVPGFLLLMSIILGQQLSLLAVCNKVQKANVDMLFLQSPSHKSI